MKQYHALSVVEVYKELSVSQQGLTSEEAAKRLTQYGRNKLEEKEKVSPLKIFLSQFTGFLVYLLFGAAALSIVIGEYLDGGAILLILFLNGLLGFIQEYKAEQAMDALKKLETPHARVTRDGVETVVTAEEVVPGDILSLGEGDKVPADARLIEAFYLQTDEAILTGESRPVTKTTDVLDAKLTLPDRRNMIFSGTVVTKGRAKALVCSTGMSTEIGHIATMVTEAEETETPLQQTLGKLGKMLGIICVVVAVPGLVLGIVKGREWIEMVMTAISLAVSAIPEGLPVVVTIALALGTRKMVKKGVLIRKLSSVEALGSTDVICSDKTGTITLNKMTVTDMYLSDIGNLHVSGEGLVGEFRSEDEKVYTKESLYKRKDIHAFVQCSVLCNDSGIDFGDPTERALFVLGEKIGISTEEQRGEHPRVDEVPFDSANKYMITVNTVGGKKIAYMKGAPEVVLSACQTVQGKDGVRKLESSEKTKVLKQNELLSGKALRVLGLAYKELGSHSSHDTLEGYTFVGLVGMIDPPRPEVAEAVKVSNRAGIRVIMITGDHPLTAGAIARQIGLKFESVTVGPEVDALSENQLCKLVEKQAVFARVSPANKLQILRALQKNKHLVAMTGDGVNDAPALKEANIGIAVGSGSDLAKEISDMVLLDDNFATIAKAIHEGRGIFFNIKKFVRFLIAANFDEILAILTSILFGTPLPFLPIHLLWLNLATDSLPALALSVDKYEPGLMDRKPYDPRKEIIHGVFTFSVLAGILAFFATMGVFFGELYGLGASIRTAQTMAFTVTVLFEFAIVFSCRSDKSAFQTGIFSNKFLWMAVGVGFVMQMFAVYFPYTHEVFSTVALGLDKWPVLLAGSFSGFLIIESWRALSGKAQSLAISKK